MVHNVNLGKAKIHMKLFLLRKANKWVVVNWHSSISNKQSHVIDRVAHNSDLHKALQVDGTIFEVFLAPVIYNYYLSKSFM